MSKSRNKRSPKRVLALPDLEQAKSVVLNTLTSVSGQRMYDHAINDFVEWYCSEPRLAFNRTVVLRYRLHLEQKGYAPNTIHLRLAAVRRVAYEACDSGLLSPELGAGMRRLKGVRRLGVRVGNWLASAQAKLLLERSDIATRRGKRNHAILATLVGCGLRRGVSGGLSGRDFLIVRLAGLELHRVPAVLHVQFVQRAVILVGTRFRHQRHIDPRGMSDRSIEAGGLDLHFGDHVPVR